MHQILSDISPEAWVNLILSALTLAAAMILLVETLLYHRQTKRYYNALATQEKHTLTMMHELSRRLPSKTPPAVKSSGFGH